MNGYQLSFYTTMGRRTHGKPTKEWLFALAREIGIPGATVFAGVEGYGHDKRTHAAHFFELTDEPIVVTMIVTEEQKERLFSRLNSEDCDLFYAAHPVAFGTFGKAAKAAD